MKKLKISIIIFTLLFLSVIAAKVYIRSVYGELATTSETQTLEPVGEEEEGTSAAGLTVETMPPPATGD